MEPLTIYAKDLAPWTPDIDPRRMDKSGIISGRNFLFDIDGPRSAYGMKFLDYGYWQPRVRRKISEIRLGDQIMYGTPRGVFKINPETRLQEPVLIFGAQELEEPFWPWTTATVGNLYYFAQYGIGLYQYDPDTNHLKKVITPAGDNIRGICESYSRLCLISDTLAAWSAIDDGTDFVPSIDTGAGAQATSLLGGIPQRIDPVENGFIVATTLGLIEFEHVDAEYVFHPYVLSNDVRIFSPNAGARLYDVGMIYVDAAGFHATNGAVPQPWETDMGAYLKDKIIKRMEKNQTGALGMYFSQSARMLFVYFSPNEEEGYMRRTFVYNLPSGKWGSFDFMHYGFFEAQPLNNLNLHSCCCMLTDGYMRILADVPYQEVVRLDNTNQHILSDYVLRPFEEPDTLKFFASTDKGVGYTMLGATDFNYSDTNPSVFLPYSQVQLIEITDDGPVPLQLPQIGLNSYIDVGPFRWAQQKWADECSSVQLIGIGSSPTIVDFTDENLNTEAGTEDLNAESGTEDSGSTMDLGDVFKLELLDTDDGFSMPVQGWEACMIMKQNGASSYYSPTGYSSIFHRLRLSALDVGQTYALKTIDITGALTGRLYG